MHVEARGVEVDVGTAAQVLGERPLGRDPVEDRAGVLQRVGPPDLLVAAHERGVVGVEEDDPVLDAVRPERLDDALELVEELLAPGVDDGGEPADPARRGHHPDQRCEEPRGQVVDDVPVQVLQDGGDPRAPRTRHPGDDQHLRALGSRLGGRRLEQRDAAGNRGWVVLVAAVGVLGLRRRGAIG
ncbi:hypothetical protein GCM10025875_11580 [Litorihabitans aurantiacus]|uniref:Uncharacterized protein n=1 Tax=Litorihabitans aurantiacus TaxID=1930061 RepID=A0AA37UQP1_9MICO|nr:hypothetical protein GCM10025875_11580 [Litorihabitans aurantiacus]